jgi:ABC-type multidrug transport system fused ATPase/permease subunit
MSGIAGARDVRRQIGQSPEELDVVRPLVDRTAPPGAIELDDVSFSYITDVPVLDHLTLRIAAGEHVALVGASGSGKTTIANLVMRFIEPDSGRLSVGGRDTAVTDEDVTRRDVALVAQSTFLFTGTLRENLQVANPDATDEQLLVALADANLAEFVAALPQGLDTEVGERGLAVSGGQAQRIAIARAFLKDSPILVLDEPTSNVDLSSEAAILASIDRLAEGRTVLQVAHRLNTVRGADRIVVLDNGRILEEGSHEELLRRGGAYAHAVARTEAKV